METAIQIFLNSIVSGLLLSLVAIGFTYIFRVTKVFHLAHGGIYVAGGFASWWMFSKTGNWIYSGIFALFIVSGTVFIFEKIIYLPLSRKQSNQSITLISSMGLYVVIVNLLALLFGYEIRVFDITKTDLTIIGYITNSGADKVVTSISTNNFQMGEIIMTKTQIIQVSISVTILFCLLTYFRFSKSKLVLQSISDNENMSKVFGINTETERIRVFIIGSALACISAILKTLEIGIEPQAGMSITLTAAVVAILVSRLNVLLIIAFTIVLTLLQNTVEWFLNAQWKDGVTFLVLLLVILFRTEGIISYNLRKDRA